MKIKLFFFFLLAITLKGFSQEKTIEIQSQTTHSNTVTLTPACGKGTETELPFTVLWDKKTETIKIDFKSNKTSDKSLFFFPKRMFIKKEVMKLRKEVWFAKEVKKCQTKKTVNSGVDTKNIFNIEYLSPDTIKTLDLSDSKATMSLLFHKAFQNNGEITIPFHFYIVSNETLKKGKNMKIEYEAIFTLTIKKRGETGATTTPAKPAILDKPSTPPTLPKEPVDCKTLYKANEQLGELLLDLKNSAPSTLASLKQKYATIKKSVENPEYKKCKEEYKAFESLCGKIDNRLK